MTVHGLAPAGTGPRRTERARERSPARAATRRGALALAALAIASCLATPAGLASAATPSTSSLDAATKRALELQSRLDGLEAEQAAIQLRLDDAAHRLRIQDGVVAKAQADATRAQEALDNRAVAMYKSPDVDAIALIAGSATWEDVVTRASLITRVLETDGQVLKEAEAAAERARKEADTLARLQKENLALRELQSQRVASARAALSEQRRIVANLSEQARRLVAAAKASAAATTNKRTRSSPAGGTRIPKVPVVVHPYDGTFLAADYAPRTFRATGETFSGLASWYGAAVDGHKTSSGRIFNHEDFTCAHRSLPFGTWLAVSRGDRRVIVMVTDRGPYTAGRVLDLSEAAAQALGVGGVKTVTAEVVVRD